MILRSNRKELFEILFDRFEKNTLASQECTEGRL